jgi:hypothetical protein
VSSKRLSNLPTWLPRDGSDIVQLDGVSRTLLWTINL